MERTFRFSFGDRGNNSRAKLPHRGRVASQGLPEQINSYDLWAILQFIAI